ncbi:helix-turn-helix transcriptional regulator [Parasulfitobacter algicola]|uniref:LuxR family transcriptional regulator n=1 Tax=Parasulfitobacter algicola TaxID=2614809 RepID=A0ABX2IUS8_9RHOB|nr:LuxR family transcriptional regulator [Sulfitobacter algicola]NSX55766.1 LuxR family transcriptional regulator [Sulfitobacter algicola]
MTEISLQDFTDATSRCTNAQDLWDLALQFYTGRGVKMVSYHHYGTHERDEMELSGLAINAFGFPQDWVDHYISNELFRVDPIPELSMQSTKPFFWSDIDKVKGLLTDQKDYMKEFHGANIGDGLAIAVYGPAYRNGYVGLGFGDVKVEMNATQIVELQCASQIAHLRYCEVTAEDARKKRDLSPREFEILQWIARGKSNRVIADILGVSPHTVDTLVRRVFDKLNVADRTTAAIKGIGSGLLQFNP